MAELIVACAWFCVLLLIHVVWFRLNRPASDVTALMVFLAVGLVLYVAALLAPGCPSRWAFADPRHPLATPLAMVSIGLYAVLAISYTGVYQASVLVAPSAFIMRLIARHPEGRMTYEDLSQVFTNERVLLPRMADLVAEGLAEFDGTRYRLRPKGLATASFFAAYRRLLRKGMGG